MSKSSNGRVARRAAKKFINPVKRNLTPQEVSELYEMQRLILARKFEAAQVSGNTALVPDGQKVAQQLTAIAAVIENSKNHWVAQKLVECGYAAGTKCSINLSTGEITIDETQDVTPNDSKA